MLQENAPAPNVLETSNALEMTEQSMRFVQKQPRQFTNEENHNPKRGLKAIEVKNTLQKPIKASE